MIPEGVGLQGLRNGCMQSDEKETFRQRVAAENNFQLYKSYSERDAAERIGWNYSTLKRKRRRGLVPFVDRGGGSVAYMGYHIADIILFGVRATHEELEADPVICGSPTCQNTRTDLSNSASGSFTSGIAAPLTTVPVTTGPPASSP